MKIVSLTILAYKVAETGKKEVEVNAKKLVRFIVNVINKENKNSN